jgi:hypothetical protein
MNPPLRIWAPEAELVLLDWSVLCVGGEAYPVLGARVAVFSRSVQARVAMLLNSVLVNPWYRRTKL